MTSISASTTHSIKKKKVKNNAGKVAVGRATAGKKKKAASSSSSNPLTRRGSVAPKLAARDLSTKDAIAALHSLSESEQTDRVMNLIRRAFGERPSKFQDGMSTKPRSAASTTVDRSHAAADLAVATSELGLIRVLKRMGVLRAMEGMLIPQGIGVVFGNEHGTNPGGGMKKIASANSLTGLVDSLDEQNDVMSVSSNGTGTVGTVDSKKKGKLTSPEGREGSLLILRALCEIVGRPAEPFVVPLLAAALDESSSSSSSVRDAAEDASTAIVALANPHAVPLMVMPVLFEALHSPEWRVKHNALERISQCSITAPHQVCRALPTLIPKVTGQIWDTKPQVTKAAGATLLACCSTNANPDVAPAIPAVVGAIVKPTETVKAIEELKATTFVATVDASTLSILCPVLSRGLKDKLALNKRSTCIVIENMSRLVETPDAVAPFGPLLVPELRKVAENVQFEEIRDAALAALKALTRALGHSSIEDAVKSIMAEEAKRVEDEQRRIEDEREAERLREEQNQKKEEEERKMWKEAMEAQRLLDKMAEKDEEEKKAEEAKKREAQKKSTKSKDGKCQGCGLKKCKKSCLFYSEAILKCT